MTTRRATAHAVGLLHAEPTMEDGVESLGADLKCSESSPDRYCPAVVSLKVRDRANQAYESFDRAGLLRLSRGLATDAPARLRAKGGDDLIAGETPDRLLTQINISPWYSS
jgi:hypothetical protein